MGGDDNQAWALVSFHVLVAALLALDLGLFHRKAHEVKIREAILYSVAWIAVAGLFCGYIAFKNGPQRALVFATAYVVEKSLSVDNIFVFVVIFASFKVPKDARHRVLFWGVLGAIGLRFPLIYGGIALLDHFHGLMYLFGAFLVFTGIKLLFGQEGEGTDIQEGRVVKLLRRWLPQTDGYRGSKLFVRENGRLLATPLFVTLVVVELSDVLFAVDSIPAVLAVVPSNDFYVAYTSNIFAILGLRALFFVVSASVERFHYLKPALSFILVFVGIKMILGAVASQWQEVAWLKINPGVSLLVILGALIVAVVASIRVKRHDTWAEEKGGGPNSSEASPPPV